MHNSVVIVCISTAAMAFCYFPVRLAILIKLLLYLRIDFALIFSSPYMHGVFLEQFLIPSAMANSWKAPEAYWSQFIFSNDII